MSLPSCSTHRATAPSIAITLALLTTFAVGGCNPDREVVGPDAGPAGPPAGLLASAIQLRVDLSAGKVSVGRASVLNNATKLDGAKPSFALLGANEVSAETGPVSRSPVGNRVRVTFDLTLRNNLRNADLGPSTFPTPPVGEVVAFPFATEPAGLFGLKVRASTDWDGTGASGSGAPHNFFNDGLCVPLTPPSDCFRWEAFGSQIAAGGAAGPRRVGFDVDPSVTAFTVYVVVAADIHERTIAPGTGGVAGNVSSALTGPLAGVVVTATPGGTATTNGRGFYSFSNLSPGGVSLTLSSLPSGCATPAATPATVAAGGVTEVSFNLTCVPPDVGAGLTAFLVRVGDGGTTLGSGAAPVFLEVRDLASGGVVQTFPLPTTTVGTQTPFTLAGIATQEGGLSLSADGRFVTLAGYAAAPGTAAVGTTTSSAVNRIVARVDAAGTIESSTRLSTAFSGGSVRSATSRDGSAFWVTGSIDGVQYTTLGTSTATQVSSTPANLRQTHIFGGQLYATSSTTGNAMLAIGTGTPTTGGATATLLPGFPTTGLSPQGFAMVDVGNTGTINTIYLAQDAIPAAGTLNIQKWVLSGSTWTQATFQPAFSPAQGARGIAARVLSGGNVLVIATTTGGQLVKLLDTGIPSPAVLSIGTAGANIGFRGVAFSPTPFTAVPFNVLSAASTGTFSATVTFDGPPNPAQATALANYAVSGLTLSGTPTLDGNTVTLATAAQSAVSYTVSVAGVTRAGDGQPLATNSATFVGHAALTIGGNLSGLDGAVVLQNNGGDDLALTANGAFAFATPVPSGGGYQVTVKTQPAGQICAVTNGAGTNVTSDVSNVQVDCATDGTAGLTVFMVRVGDGAAGLGSTAAPVFLEEYDLASGAQERRFALPTTTTGTQTPFTLAGTATQEGGLSLSADGRFITLAGYAAAPGTASVGTTASSAVNRIVARMDATGSIETSTGLGTAFSGGSVRAATSRDGSAFWVTGSVDGVQYIPLGTNAAQQVSSTPANLRQTHIFGGQLYATSSTTGNAMLAIGTGTPTTGGATATLLPGFPTTSLSPTGFAMVDVGNTGAINTLYFAQDGIPAAGTINIQKWVLSGATWSQAVFQPSFSTALGARGLAARVLPSGNVIVVATTTGGQLVKVLDTGIPNPAAIALTTAAVNTGFRGVAFSPSP